jgi:hypothetical protein
MRNKTTSLRLLQGSGESPATEPHGDALCIARIRQVAADIGPMSERIAIELERVAALLGKIR